LSKQAFCDTFSRHPARSPLLKIDLNTRWHIADLATCIEQPGVTNTFVP